MNEGKEIDSSTSLEINNIVLKPGKDFFPFPFSPDIKMEALSSIALRESDMPWFFDLKETIDENKDNPHFDLDGFIKTKAEVVKKKNASALFIYNTSTVDDKLVFTGKDRSAQLSIPVIFVADRKSVV